MSACANIYLTGPRGSGKTTIGRMLACQMGLGFVDLDHFLVEKHGRTIAEIVRDNGWDCFRDMESEILREATEKADPAGNVIATGGGIVLKNENREYMQTHGLVIWLWTDAEKLCARLGHDPRKSQRPPLTAMDPREEIRKVLAEREAFYASCAHHKVDAGASPQAVCSAIHKLLDKKFA